MTEILYGKPVAESIYAQTQNVCKNRSLTLTAIGFSSPQWQQYVGSLKKSAATCGVKLENVVMDENVAPEVFFEAVRCASSCKNVDGVLVQQPLPKQYAAAVDFVSPQKDVDCLNSVSVAKLYKGEECLLPATPLAVIKLLEYYGVDLCGKNVVIVGRGNAVGKPLALMCLKRNATVTVCHTKTVNLAEICKRADVLVSACGVAGLITEDFVSERSVVVDVGLSFVNGKTCGDVASEVYQKALAVSPVPGGIGSVTRATLFGNLIDAIKN